MPSFGLLSYRVLVVCPRREDEVARLLVEGVVLHIHVTHRHEQRVGHQHHVAAEVEDGVGLVHAVSVAGVGAGNGGRKML